MQPIKEEYERLRLGAGLTDCSSYQAFELSGSAATDDLNRMALADVTRLPIGRVLATYMLREDATLLADVLIWNQGGRFLILAETSETGSLEGWIAKHATTSVVKNLSPEILLAGY